MGHRKLSLTSMTAMPIATPAITPIFSVIKSDNACLHPCKMNQTKSIVNKQLKGLRAMPTIIMLAVLLIQDDKN